MTNTPEGTLTYGQYSAELLDSLVANVIAETVARELLRERQTRKHYGSVANPKIMPSAPSSAQDIGRFAPRIGPRDVYAAGLADNAAILGDKTTNVKTGTAQDTYFSCRHCNRQIAGSRFAAHIDKCLGGRSRK